MDDIEFSYEEKENELRKRLENLPKEKWKIWRLIAVGIITPFILPYFPMRRGMLADRMGYKESVFLFVVIFIIVVPIGCYMHFQKINNEIFEAECDLESLIRKREKIFKDNIND